MNPQRVLEPFAPTGSPEVLSSDAAPEIVFGSHLFILRTHNSSVHWVSPTARRRFGWRSHGSCATRPTGGLDAIAPWSAIVPRRLNDLDQESLWPGDRRKPWRPLQTKRHASRRSRRLSPRPIPIARASAPRAHGPPVPVYREPRESPPSGPRRQGGPSDRAAPLPFPFHFHSVG